MIGGRHRVAVLALWLLYAAGCGVLIARASFTADLSAFLPASPDARQRVLIEQLQSGVAARTLMLGIEGGNATQRAQASRDLATALRAGGLFEQVQNGDASAWQSAGTWLFDHRYQLSPGVSAQRFTAAGLREAIDDTVSQLGTPAGEALKPVLERDPTGEIQHIAESLIPAAAPRSEAGVWVSRQAPRAVLLASTRAAGADLDAQARAIERVHAAFAPSASQGLTLKLSGPPLFAVQSRSTIEAEAKQLSIAGSVIVGGLLLAAFASLRALLVGLLPVATGLLTGIAAVSLAFPTVHAMTLGFGSTLIGETVDYAIYYLIQARGASVPGGGWRHWLADSWPTVRLGLFTSICGFAALVFSGFPGLAQLGVFSIAGLIGAALATRFVLPLLMPDGAPGAGLRRQMARIAAGVVRGLPKARAAIVALAALAAGLMLWHTGPLWSGDLASLSPVPPQAQSLDASLRADLGASDARTLVVAQGPDRQAALRAAEEAGSRLDRLVEQGRILGYETPARLLPSIAAQTERLAALPDETTLRASLQQATASGPLSAQRLAPFVAEVQKARQHEPVDRAALQGSPLAPVVDAMLFRSRDGGWSALLALQPAGQGIDASQVRAAMQGLPEPAVQVIDIKHELDNLYTTYLREASLQAGLGALAVIVLLGGHLRSARRLWVVCQPLAMAVLLTMGGLVAAGVPLGILHLVGLLLVVAVGSNYALFFDQLREQGRMDNDTLASLGLANITTVASFGLIALSAIPALSAIGRVVAPGALLALLLAAAFSHAPAAGKVT